MSNKVNDNEIDLIKGEKLEIKSVKNKQDDIYDIKSYDIPYNSSLELNQMVTKVQLEELRKEKEPQIMAINRYGYTELVNIEEEELDALEIRGNIWRKLYGLEPFDETKLYQKSDSGGYMLDMGEDFDIIAGLSGDEREYRALMNRVKAAPPVEITPIKDEDMPGGFISYEKKDFRFLIILTVLMAGLYVANILPLPIIAIPLILMTMRAYISYVNYRLIKARQFRAFNGYISAVYISGFWKYKRYVLQVSDGRNTLAFYYPKYQHNKVEVGTPCTLYIAEGKEVKDSEYGPLIDYYIAVEFNSNINNIDKKGKYDEYKAKNVNIHSFFEDKVENEQ